MELAVHSSAEAIVPIVLELVPAKSVIDIGCGIGEWLSVFQARGVTRCVGVDGGHIDQSQLKIPREHFVVADLTQPQVLEARFDLATCLEVAEHLPPAVAQDLVKWLCSLSSAVLFSAAIPFQTGNHHINEQWPDYWQALFERQGFVACDCLRLRFWDDPRVTWYYSQNLILYIERRCLNDYPLLEGRPHKLPRLVHPQRFLRTATLKCYSLPQVLRALPELLKRSFEVRWRRWFGRDTTTKTDRLR